MGGPPDCRQNLTSHHRAGVLGEKCQKLELLGREPNLLARSLDAMARVVDLDIRDPHQDRFRWPCDPVSGRRTDPCHQFADPKRLELMSRRLHVLQAYAPPRPLQMSQDLNGKRRAGTF